jgi:hypothetical protein
MAHVIRTMQDNAGVDDPFAEPLYATPPVLAALLEKGALGQKAGAGFYRKDGKVILRSTRRSGDYVPAGGKADETVARILKKKDPAERLKLLRESKNPQAKFVWAILRDSFHYAAMQPGVDRRHRARRRLRDALGLRMARARSRPGRQAGWTQVAEWIQADIDAGEALSKCRCRSGSSTARSPSAAACTSRRLVVAGARRVRRPLRAAGLPRGSCSARRLAGEGAPTGTPAAHGVRGRLGAAVDARARRGSTTC